MSTRRRKPSSPPVASEGRRERNKREKQARIIESARHLFGVQGYRQTTAQQIAERAQIAGGTLFLYAKSKEDLLVLVFTQEMRELIETATRRIDPDATFLEQTATLFKRFVDYHARDAEIARELIRELTFLSNPERVEQVNAIVSAIVGKLAVFARRAIARGELTRDTDPVLLARCLFSIYYQQLQTWLGGYVTRRAFERHLRLMLAHVIDARRS
jgi:AcrR family transcriptional regulator